MGVNVGPIKTLAIGTDGGGILPADTGRNYLMIQADADVHIQLSELPSGNAYLLLKSGDRWEPARPPGDAIFVASATGTANVQYASG